MKASQGYVYFQKMCQYPSPEKDSFGYADVYTVQTAPAAQTDQSPEEDCFGYADVYTD